MAKGLDVLSPINFCCVWYLGLIVDGFTIVGRPVYPNIGKSYGLCETTLIEVHTGPISFFTSPGL